MVGISLVELGGTLLGELVVPLGESLVSLGP